MIAAVSDLAQLVRDHPDQFIDERARRKLLWFTDRMVSGYLMANHIENHLVPALEWATSTPDARLIVTMPPRHSKSLHVSENLPAWYLGKNPSHRIIAASHTASLAYTFSRRVRNKVADPRWPFPDVKLADDKAAVQSWDTDQGGGYIAVGVGGSPTGHGGNGIIIDDPLRSAADADSQNVRDALHEWYRETIRTRLEPGGWIVITATRWHTDDLTGMLLRDAETGGEEWRHVHMPAIDDNNVPLWPERWSVEALDAIKRSVGSRAWDAQYQGNPTPADGGILKRHWLNTYRMSPNDAMVVQSWDSAFKTGESNDYSVCTTIAYTKTGRYILDVYRERLEYPDLKRMVPRLYGEWTPNAVLIEDKASGQSLLQDLRRETDIPLIPISVPNTKDWKIVRANELAPLVESGLVYFPESATWLAETVSELTTFPMAAHDDIADSILQGLRWIEQKVRSSASIVGSWIPDDEEDEWERRYQ